MGGRRRPQSRQETFAGSRPQQTEQFFQREDTSAASDRAHRGSRAQFALVEPPQPPNGYRSQPLSRLQAIDLGGIEGQARQGRAPQCRRKIASPALLLQAPALFEFTIGIILNVPAWAKRLQGGKAISEFSSTHQRARRLGGRFLAGHIMDEAGPQAGIARSIAHSLLGNAVPTPQVPELRYLH